MVTSPPYWGLRDYGHPDQIGLETTPTEYVAHMVAVFREIHRVLRDDGTVWLNLGDSYTAGGMGGHQKSDTFHGHEGKRDLGKQKKPPPGMKPKNLVGIPWRVAFALQDDGWYLRQDIIWAKGNPMPEPVTDRCTRSHEYLFMLTKQPRYYYDCDAIREPQVFGEKDRNKKRFPEDWKKRKETHGSVNGGYQAWEKAGANKNDGWTCGSPKDGLRNKRSVWHINPKPFRGAHFATMPPGLVEPCVLAGTSEAGCCPTCLSPWRRVIETSGGRDWRKDCQCDPLPPIPCTVLDPFGGSGTVGMVAQWNGRNSVLCELNQDYANLIYQRINTPREKKPTTPKQLEPQDQNQSVLDLI